MNQPPAVMSDGEPTDQAVNAFTNDIKAAVYLQHMYYLREMDREFEADGLRTIFAIDSNVLYQYFRTSDQVSFPKYQLSAYDVFRGPTDRKFVEPDRNIGGVITRFILHTLQSSGSNLCSALLLLPGHNVEATSLYDRIARDFHDQQNKGKNAKRLISEYLDLLDKTPDGDARMKLALEWENKIYDLLYNLKEPHEKFRDYNQLLANGRLMKLARAAQEPAIANYRNPDTGKQIFLDYDKHPNEDPDEGSVQWWESRLKKNIPSHFRASDRRALAALDKINRLAKHHKFRVVLVTLNEEIIRIGMKYRPHKYSDKKLGKFTFSDLYLRHPKYFLFEPAIMDPSKSPDIGGGKTAWLRAFLANVTEPDHVDVLSFRIRSREISESERLKELARDLLKRRPEQHETLCREWQEYVSNLTLAHSSASPIAIENIAACIRQGTGGRVRVLDQINDYVTELTENSWNDFFLTATQSGYDLIGLSYETMSLPRRKIPPLIPRGISGSAKLLRLIDEPCGPSRNKAEIVAALDELGRNNDDSSGYLRTLCYAVLFAYANRWPVAKLIAQRAGHIARRINKMPRTDVQTSDEHNRVTGREAYYFSAVAHRLTAKKASDLGECERLILTAQEAEQMEPDFAKSHESERRLPQCDPPLTGLRLRAERIAIDVARLLFQYFGSAPQRLPKDVVTTTARDIMVRIEHELLLAGDCEHEIIRTATKITLRGDFFCMILMLELCDDVRQIERDQINHLLVGQLQDFAASCTTSDGELNLSVADIITSIYAASFHQHIDPILEKIDRKYALLDELEERHFKPYLMPYDKPCFDKMRELRENRERAD